MVFARGDIFSVLAARWSLMASAVWAEPALVAGAGGVPLSRQAAG